MRDNKYILAKVFKKQTIALMLFSVLVVLFLINLFNRPVAYASEQIANVKCDVIVACEDEVNIISSNTQTFSYLDESVINFDDINVDLERDERLEIVYDVININNDNYSFVLKLVDEDIQNFIIKFYLNDELCEGLTEKNVVLKSMETAEFKVVIYVEDYLNDAALNGSLELSFECVGGNNG